MKKGKLKFLSLILGSLFYCAPTCCVSAQSMKIYPPEESIKDPTLRKLNIDLLNAINSKNEKYILGILDPNITNGFGGSGGVAEFKTQWKLGSSKSELWNVLSKLVSLGGSFDIGNKYYCFPYLYLKFPKSRDPFTSLVIIDKSVKVYAKPDLNATIVGTLNYDVINGSIFDKVWNKVSLPENKFGYVLNKFSRSPLDYRACFEKKNDQWVLTLLVNGD